MRLLRIIHDLLNSNIDRLDGEALIEELDSDVVSTYKPAAIGEINILLSI